MLDDPKSNEGQSRQINPGDSNASLIEVWVTKESAGSKPNEIICSITPKPGSEHYVADDEINLPSYGGPFQVTFELKPPLNWQASDPFDTQKGTCPARGGNCSDQIWQQPPNGKTLSILNLNGGSRCDVHYRMNFDDGTWCDPVMNNGGNS